MADIKLSGKVSVQGTGVVSPYAKSGLAWFVYRRMDSMLKKSIEKGEPDLNITFIYNMPFRGIASRLQRPERKRGFAMVRRDHH